MQSAIGMFDAGAITCHYAHIGQANGKQDAADTATGQ
jgi:hypothetical protein